MSIEEYILRLDDMKCMFYDEKAYSSLEEAQKAKQVYDVFYGWGEIEVKDPEGNTHTLQYPDTEFEGKITESMVEGFVKNLIEEKR